MTTTHYPDGRRCGFTYGAGSGRGDETIGDTRACPDCGRPQHYTGTEVGWSHDAGWSHNDLIDTWHCADPRKAGA